MTDWREFLDRYYKDAIFALANDYPSRRSLVIDFQALEIFDNEGAFRLEDEPDNVLKEMMEVLKDYDLPVLVDNWNPSILISNAPNVVRRRDLRDEHIGKLVVLNGLVQRTTEVSPRVINAAFMCLRCYHVSYIHQDERGFIEPFECENETCLRKNCFKFDVGKSEKVNAQMIRLQELPEELKGGEKSQIIDVNLVEDLTGFLVPGNRVTITGILRARQVTTKSGKSPFLSLYLDALHVEVNDSKQTIIVTPQDEERFRLEAKKPDIIDKLVRSFAPTVYGLKRIKQGLLCSLVSNGYSIRSDGTPQREYSHILVCGDPGTAKSNLKHAAKAIKPDIVLSSGTGATTAGLTAAAIKDDFANGSWSIEAGVLPLADNGTAVIDEFDKIKKEEAPKLNDALSNCCFEKDAAGLHVKLWARCSVIALLNPKHGRFDQYSPAMEQVAVSPDTLSRFDLIFLIPDKPTPEKDEKVADHIIGAWTSGIYNTMQEVFSIEDLQKYIALAYSTKIDKYDPEALELIKNTFLSIRRQGTEGTVSITNRYLESLFRLSKAHAQLSLDNVFRKSYVENAIELLESGLLESCTDEHGNRDMDIIDIGTSKSQRDRMNFLINVICDLSKDDGKRIASIGDIVLKIQEFKWGIDRNQLDNMLSKLKSAGDIIEVSEGKFRAVV